LLQTTMGVGPQDTLHDLPGFVHRAVSVRPLHPEDYLVSLFLPVLEPVDHWNYTPVRARGAGTHPLARARLPGRRYGLRIPWTHNLDTLGFQRQIPAASLPGHGLPACATGSRYGTTPSSPTQRARPSMPWEGVRNYAPCSSQPLNKPLE